MERRDYETNQTRTAAVTDLQRELQAWPSLGDGRVQRDWIAAVNDKLFRSLPGTRVAFMTRETGSHVVNGVLDLALFVPSCLMRFFVGRPVLWYPSVVVEITADGTMKTAKNRYGDQRELVSLQQSVTLSDPGMPPCIVRFTTVVPDGR